MSLDLRNFVEINIQYVSRPVSSISRGLVTLISVDNAFRKEAFEGKVFYSFSEYASFKSKNSLSGNLDGYVESFFVNGGKKLQILSGIAEGQSQDDFIVEKTKELDYSKTIIVSDADEDVLRKAVKTMAENAVSILEPTSETGEKTINAFGGLNEKIFISSTADTSGNLFDKISARPEAFDENTYYKKSENKFELLESAPADWETGYSKYYVKADLEDYQFDNYCVKVGTKGIEMLAAAYLSIAKIDTPSTLQQYAFTIETLKSSRNGGYDFTASAIDSNDTGIKLIKSNLNITTNLANAYRNYPGDTITGKELMNHYLKICLTQDLSEALINLLSSKIKFNQTGINRLNNTISQAMNPYISNGYLNTEFIYTGEDIEYEFNGKTYTVCTANTPFPKGYKCSILPLTSLTYEQQENHILPPVYIIFADQTGIRKLVINGELY